MSMKKQANIALAVSLLLVSIYSAVALQPGFTAEVSNSAGNLRLNAITITNNSTGWVYSDNDGNTLPDFLTDIEFYYRFDIALSGGENVTAFVLVDVYFNDTLTGALTFFDRVSSNITSIQIDGSYTLRVTYNFLQSGDFTLIGSARVEDPVSGFLHEENSTINVFSAQKHPDYTVTSESVIITSNDLNGDSVSDFYGYTISLNLQGTIDFSRTYTLRIDLYDPATMDPLFNSSLISTNPAFIGTSTIQFTGNGIFAPEDGNYLLIATLEVSGIAIYDFNSTVALERSRLLLDIPVKFQIDLFGDYWVTLSEYIQVDMNFFLDFWGSEQFTYDLIIWFYSYDSNTQTYALETNTTYTITATAGWNTFTAFLSVPAYQEVWFNASLYFVTPNQRVLVTTSDPHYPQAPYAPISPNTVPMEFYLKSSMNRTAITVEFTGYVFQTTTTVGISVLYSLFEYVDFADALFFNGSFVTAQGPVSHNNITGQLVNDPTSGSYYYFTDSITFTGLFDMNYAVIADIRIGESTDSLIDGGFLWQFFNYGELYGPQTYLSSNYSSVDIDADGFLDTTLVDVNFDLNAPFNEFYVGVQIDVYEYTPPDSTSPAQYLWVDSFLDTVMFFPGMTFTYRFTAMTATTYYVNVSLFGTWLQYDSFSYFTDLVPMTLIGGTNINSSLVEYDINLDNYTDRVDLSLYIYTNETREFLVKQTMYRLDTGYSQIIYDYLDFNYLALPGQNNEYTRTIELYEAGNFMIVIDVYDINETILYYSQTYYLYQAVPDYSSFVSISGTYRLFDQDKDGNDDYIQYSLDFNITFPVSLEVSWGIWYYDGDYQDWLWIDGFTEFNTYNGSFTILLNYTAPFDARYRFDIIISDSAGYVTIFQDQIMTDLSAPNTTTTTTISTSTSNSISTATTPPSNETTSLTSTEPGQNSTTPNNTANSPLLPVPFTDYAVLFLSMVLIGGTTIARRNDNKVRLVLKAKT